LSFSSLGERVSIGVKARVLYSRLLTSNDYWSLLESETVTEVVGKLRSTAYGDFLSTLPEEPHRHEIEEAVKSSLINQAENFIIHFSSPRDRFFHAWFACYEAENLKSIFRYIRAGRTSERDDLRRRLYSIKTSKVSFENVLLAKNFSEVADALRGTRFYRVLKDPLSRLSTGEERSLFPLEMALDSFVEITLFKALKKLDPSEREMLLPIFGTRIDLYNIYLLYRSMVFYDMTPEETLNRLLPARYRVSLAILREAARLKSYEDMIEKMKERFPVYAQLLVDAVGDAAPQLALERNIKRYIYMQAKKVFNSAPPGFHTAMSYFVMRNFEIGDIIHVIEVVRYGYDRWKAAAYLVTPVVLGGEIEWQY
jgi:V/A-type H+-transporting ATPase subunit C